MTNDRVDASVEGLETKPPLEPIKLSGPRVTLRPVYSSDYDWIYGTALAPEVGPRWRFRGFTPSPESFASILWTNVAVQFIAVENATGNRIGLFQLYDVNPSNGFGYVAVLFAPQYYNKGWPQEGTLLFFHYVFVTQALRKVYLEATDRTLPDYESAVGPFLKHEGRLCAHEFLDGVYMDLHVLALYRETWDEQKPIVERILRSGREGGA